MKLALRIVVILACNWLLYIWFAHAFALGEYEIGGGTVDWRTWWRPMLYLTGAGICLFLLGYFGTSWPVVETAFSVAYLPWRVNDGQPIAGVLMFGYFGAFALVVSCGAHLLRRTLDRRKFKTAS